MAAIVVGTSGFSYREWRPAFYPAKMPERGFLPYYATRLNGVEIDSTFYRMPTEKTVDGWLASTPDDFRFAIKAPQRVTHRERLALPSEANAHFLRTLEPLGARLGMVLYQLPPFARVDHERLARFAEALPVGVRAAFEFRHPSWFGPVTYEILASRGLSLCLHDQDDGPPPLEITAPRTYLRLRRTTYDPEARDGWKQRMQGWSAQGIDVFAFVKHKDNPRAPLIALEFSDGLVPRRDAEG